MALLPILSGNFSRLTLTDELRTSYEENGFLKFEGVVDPKRLGKLHAFILDELAQSVREQRLFAGGGTVSGHLNCFPGVASRFVHDTLEARGIFDIVRALSPNPLSSPNIGCNLNLSHSKPQNEHVDGDAAKPFLVVNVAVVDTDRTNGAMEIICRTHREDLRYWRVLVSKRERLRLCLKQGDVVLRTSRLWHRGMPNFRSESRPMLAFTWEDGGSKLDDPYAAHEGRVTFLPNRYGTDWTGRLRERAFAAAPRAGSAYLALRSLL